MRLQKPLRYTLLSSSHWASEKAKKDCTSLSSSYRTFKWAEKNYTLSSSSHPAFLIVHCYLHISYRAFPIMYCHLHTIKQQPLGISHRALPSIHHQTAVIGHLNEEKETVHHWAAAIKHSNEERETVNHQAVAIEHLTSCIEIPGLSGLKRYLPKKFKTWLNWA